MAGAADTAPISPAGREDAACVDPAGLSRHRKGDKTQSGRPKIVPTAMFAANPNGPLIGPS